MALSRTALAASKTEDPAFAIVLDPMAGWDSGRRVSPKRTSTLSGGSPSASAATWRITV
jgi:hypothetical protein